MHCFGCLQEEAAKKKAEEDAAAAKLAEEEKKKEEEDAKRKAEDVPSFVFSTKSIPLFPLAQACLFVLYDSPSIHLYSFLSFTDRKRQRKRRLRRRSRSGRRKRS